MATKRNSINDYKNRMTSPIGAIRVDKNGRPIKSTKKRGK